MGMGFFNGIGHQFNIYPHTSKCAEKIFLYIGACKGGGKADNHILTVGAHTYLQLFGADKRLEFFLPLAEAGKLGRFYALGQLDDVEYTEQGVSFVLTANDVLPGELAEYIKNGE